MPEPELLLAGLVLGESPRWHDGRLWFSRLGRDEVMAVDLDGGSEVVAAARPASVLDRLAARRPAAGRLGP